MVALCNFFWPAIRNCLVAAQHACKGPRSAATKPKRTNQLQQSAYYLEPKTKPNYSCTLRRRTDHIGGQSLGLSRFHLRMMKPRPLGTLADVTKRQEQEVGSSTITMTSVPKVTTLVQTKTIDLKEKSWYEQKQLRSRSAWVKAWATYLRSRSPWINAWWVAQVQNLI
jgi:hypothetical protein